MVFSELAKFFQRLEQTPSRISMTEILAKLFHKALKHEIGEICYLLQGRVAPLYEATEFGVADKLMIRAIAQATGVQDTAVLKEFKKQGDLGSAAEAIKNRISKVKNVNTKFTVSETFRLLKTIAETGGEGSQEKKITLLAELVQHLDPLSVRYLVRIPLDKLRLGFSDMTMLDGLSWMLTGNKSYRDALECAYNVRPDFSYIATQVKEHGIQGVSKVRAVVGAPILAALCQRLPNAEEMIRKMGEVDVEPKFDGVRTQIHFKKKDHWVQSYSRNLENTTAMYPELTHIGKQIHADTIILDSEAVGYDEETHRIIPFQETVTRKRKHDVTLFSKSVPLRFFVFDILEKDGRDLMNIPLSKRREILEKTITAGSILTVSPNIVTKNTSVLRSYHHSQIQQGLEGVVVKKWDGIYEPGRRGYNWVKFKEEGKVGKLADTVDAVVMGYYTGEGKRSGFGIGAFLVGVAEGERFVTITKIGTGVSDELWKDLAKKLGKMKAETRPKQYEEIDKLLEPDVWVSPSMVVEIAADDITKSPIHGARYALRFPRLVHIRTDKSPKEATTVKELERMYKNQKSIHP